MKEMKRRSVFVCLIKPRNKVGSGESLTSNDFSHFFLNTPMALFEHSNIFFYFVPAFVQITNSLYFFTSIESTWFVSYKFQRFGAVLMKYWRLIEILVFNHFVSQYQFDNPHYNSVLVMSNRY